jgi:hypothetical protein
MSKLFKEIVKGGKKAVAENGGWLMAESAIVADNNDPENQHRVRLIIPSIDEDLIFDEWARQLVFCLGNGFGSAFIPPKGSEVIVFGQLGQKYNLFYASVYNEEMMMPEDFENEMSVGIHAPGNLTLIAEEVAKILAQNVELAAEESAKIEGNQIQLEGGQITVNSEGSISITGGNVMISGDSVKIFNRMVNPTGPTI